MKKKQERKLKNNKERKKRVKVKKNHIREWHKRIKNREYWLKYEKKTETKERNKRYVERRICGRFDISYNKRAKTIQKRMSHKGGESISFLSLPLPLFSLSLSLYIYIYIERERERERVKK